MMKAGLTPEQRRMYRVKRTFCGKLGEMAFYRYLEGLGINSGNLEEMFAIYGGQTNVDPYDFQTKVGESVDVKTAVFANHRNVMVPIDQFQSRPKNFYVGVKLELPSEIRDYTEEFTPVCVETVYICGYATYEDIRQCRTFNPGEYPCKAKLLSELRDIAELIARF